MQDVNHQLFTESVFDEIVLGADNADTNKVEQVMERLDLISFRERHPMSLSGGQKTTGSHSRCYFSDKKMLLLDEPTSGLDFRHMEQVAELMQQLKQQGKNAS